LAVEDAKANVDGFLDNIDAKSKKFLKLLQLSRLYGKKVGHESRNNISFNDSGGDPKLYIMLGGEDNQDYDPSYIRQVQRKAKIFGEVFSIFGLVEKTASGNFAGHGYGGGPYHYADVSDFQKDFKKNLSKTSKEKIQELIKSVDKSEEERQKKEQGEEQKENNKEIRKIETEISKYKQLKDLSSEQLTFIAEYIHEHKMFNTEPSKERFGRADNFVVFVDTGFDSQVTRSTVTDYLARRVYVLDVDNKTAGVSKKESVLWRTTESGLTGNELSREIVNVEIKSSKVEVEMKDGDKIIVDMKNAKETVKASPEVREVIEKQIAEKIKQLRELHKNLKIPLLGPGGGSGTREADAGTSNIEYDDDGKGAKVTFWEEIDAKNIDFETKTQKRLTTYHVTPEGMTEISSKTEGYN